MSHKLTEIEAENIENAFLVSSSQIDRHSLINSIIAKKIADALAVAAGEVIDSASCSLLLEQSGYYKSEAARPFTGRATLKNEVSN